MANQVNVNTTTNQVTVTQGNTQIVTVTAQGPQGVKGDTGAGLSAPFTGSAIVSGSMDVIGRTSIGGPTFITGSTIISGSTSTIISDSTIITGSTTITGSAIVTGSLNVSGGITGSIHPAFELTPIIEYLDTRVELSSNTVTPAQFVDADGTVTQCDVVRFQPAFFAPQPEGFPPLEKHDFQYYVNGVLMPHTTVREIVELSNARVEVAFIRDSVGFTIQSTDVVTAIGRFDPNAFSSGFSNGFSRHVYSMVSSLLTLVLNKRT
jgi:hypothetical protein